MIFYLTTHRAGWLGRLDVPLCVQRVHLYRRRTLTPALAPWALDSGGYTALNKAGAYPFTAAEYAADAVRLADGYGSLAWAASMDWMCEPDVLAKTGLDVAEHQRRTVDSFLRLRDLAPTVPWIPVLQGFKPDDYLRCVDLYGQAGVDLAAEPLVGLGTVCRRQATREIGALISTLAESRLRLHGFGVKLDGLQRYGWALASADSMSWSIDGRKPKGGRCGANWTVDSRGRCRSHQSCANCQTYALQWRARVIKSLTRQQPTLWSAA